MFSDAFKIVVFKAFQQHPAQPEHRAPKKPKGNGQSPAPSTTHITAESQHDRTSIRTVPCDGYRPASVNREGHAAWTVRRVATTSWPHRDSVRALVTPFPAPPWLSINGQSLDTGTGASETAVTPDVLRSRRTVRARRLTAGFGAVVLLIPLRVARLSPVVPGLTPDGQATDFRERCAQGTGRPPLLCRRRVHSDV